MKNIEDKTVDKILAMENKEAQANSAYAALKNKKNLGKEDRIKLFELIKKLANDKEGQITIIAGEYLGDCYNDGLGCKKSESKALGAYKEVMKIQRSDEETENLKIWAETKIGRIYWKQGNYDEAFSYLNNSTSSEDHIKMARYRWKKGEYNAALESYKKAGKLGAAGALAEATEKCLENPDKNISDRAVEYAYSYFGSNESKKDMQKIADGVMDYYYRKLRLADMQEKEDIKKQIDRYKAMLGNYELKKKSENKIHEFVRDNKDTIGALSAIGASIGVVAKVTKTVAPTVAKNAPKVAKIAKKTGDIIVHIVK